MTTEQKLSLKAQGFKEDVKQHNVSVINVVDNKLDAYKIGRYDGYVAGYDEGFKDGAEFGYNKTNEWHYVKDELPELYKDVLVVFPQGGCDVKHLTNHNEWVGRGSWCSLTDVIAWKEIVLPKLPKESE